MSPIDRHLSIVLTASTLVALVIACLAGWWTLRERAIRQLSQSELRLVVERAERGSEQFHHIEQAHHKAQELFDMLAAEMSDREIDAHAAAAFEKRPDGSWRSQDYLFDGGFNSSVGPVYGLAAFLPPGEMTPERRRIMVAALRAIRLTAIGQADVIESLWFFTPTNDIIIFAPAREDRLMFYRRDAPPDFDFQSAPFVMSLRAAANPDGAWNCTGLSRALWISDSVNLTTGCQMAARLNGKTVGGWGTTIEMNDRLARFMQPTAPDRMDVLASVSGELIAAPGMTSASVLSRESVETIETQLGWAAIREALRQSAGASGTIRDVNSRWLVNYARMPGSGWTLVSLTDRSEIDRSLLADMPALAILAALLLGIQMVVIVTYLRTRISEPLKDLARRFGGDDAAPRASGKSRRPPLEIKVLEERLETTSLRNRDLIQDLECRVDARTRELTVERDRAESALQSKTIFLANMSHEIRTPLNGVIGLAGALTRSALDARQAEIVRLIEHSARTLERLLSDVLDVSRIEAGKFPLEESVFDLHESVEAAALLQMQAADDKGLTFAFDLDRATAGLFVGDAVRVRQIVTNLTSNAVKFTAEGGVHVAVRAGAPPADGDAMTTVEIEVSDTGVGFDVSEVERLFTRFEQIDNSMTRAYGGSGLGLSICRSLAEMMGGTISARSTPGEGSSFTVTLKLRRAQAGDHAGQAAPQPHLPARLVAAPDRPLRVLLAEDHPTNRRMVELVIESVGAQIVVASDGEEAVAQSAAERFDIILMDMHMPRMDGLTATRAIRAREGREGAPRAPIIMLSADAAPEQVAKAVSAGCDGYVTKPVTAARLLETLARVAGSETA